MEQIQETRMSVPLIDKVNKNSRNMPTILFIVYNHLTTGKRRRVC